MLIPYQLSNLFQWPMLLLMPCSSFSFPNQQYSLAKGSSFCPGLRTNQHTFIHCRDSKLSKLFSKSSYFDASDELEINESQEEKRVQYAIEKFISTIRLSLNEESFLYFTLRGPPAPRLNRRTYPAKSGINEEQRLNQEKFLAKRKEQLRGKFKKISGRLVSLRDGKKNDNKKRKKESSRGNESDGVSLHLQTTIKYHLATDMAQNWKVNECDEVELGLKRIFSSALGSSNKIDDGTDCAPSSEWGVIENARGQSGILDGEIVTSTGVYSLRLNPPSKAGLKLSKKKTDKVKQNSVQSILSRSHDKAKNVQLSPSSPFFQKLGVSSPNGKPLVGMSSKLRQCQKFVEIVGKLVDNSSFIKSFKQISTSGAVQAPPTIRVIDMGCGRGYLTFSLHSYLCNKFLMPENEETEQKANFKPGLTVQTQGIDRRPKLIKEINGIADDLGGEFSSLRFIEGDIGNTDDALFGDDSGSDSIAKNTLDILIALHACDTATDDSIWFAIQNDADIIVTAPCCHHQLRQQIDRHFTKNPDHPLADILCHAIYRERSTETTTDAMRALLLEIAGYNTQVFEFIGGEHTAKNVMITATKMEAKLADDNERLIKKRKRLIELANFYGVKQQKLAMLMGENLGWDNSVKLGIVKSMPSL
mmetsp:Transcript_13787/g.28050  ORF Transcript_13787/g.28050 Transcript_13787/m.28050 type:complete len:645 (-) Transcript_13787:122-2056(-)